ncbi:MAG: signal recognition particle-docking protein FtsY [Chloroflexota bacterium]
MVDLLNKWRDGLARTRNITFGRLAAFLGTSEINDTIWTDLEAILIQADIGIETTLPIIQACREHVQKEGLTQTEQLRQFLKYELINRLNSASDLMFDSIPAVILLVGVNGSGKTTTAAKLAYWFKQQNKKVLLVAADTFRAAAIDQLRVWSERLDVPLISGQQDGDPGAVTYDGITAGISRGVDIILIDTAGRLHTRFNLMEEIKKVYRVANKAKPGAPHACWLVLDATTGQNALQQARAFKEAVNISGIILAKLDSSAKGGMAFAVKEQLNLPILFAGLGETLEDLQVFDRDSFVESIFNS